MNRPFSIKFSWDDFDNTSKLTSFQKHRIKNRYVSAVRDAIQETIDSSVDDRDNRRSELNAHNNPNDPFKLELGGEG